MKKIKNYNRKWPAMKKLLLAAGLSLGAWSASEAQTATCTTLHQPCNNDGVLAVHISGIPLPLDYIYINNTGVIEHNSINSYDDTLYNIGSAINTVVVQSTGGYVNTSATGMVPPFAVDPPVTTNAVCPALTGSMQLTINGGVTPASVQWFSHSPTVIGPPTYVGTANPIVAPAGVYDYIVTDASGCTVSTVADSSGSVYIGNISGINYSITTTNASCTNGTATVTGISGGLSPYTYTWSNGATSAANTGLSQGAYSVTVTDAQGCYEQRNAYISQTIAIVAHPVVTDATCLQGNGSVISFGSGGTPPYSYVYSNGMTGQTAGGLAGETSLSVVATDANGCTGEGYAYIGTSTPIVATYTSTASSCTAPTGTANLSISGGTAPYSVSWGSMPALSGTLISGLAAGTYIFNITDAVGCKRSGAVNIPSASTLSASISTINPVCPAVNGTVHIYATGSNPPFTYLWNTGATTTILSGTPVGGYSCTVTDAVGCHVTKYAGLGATSPISIGLSNTQASCIYNSDGSIHANASGGTAPYIYHWNDGQTGPNAIGLSAGGYGVYVTDANGCRQSRYDNLTYNASNNSCYCTITGKVYKDLNGDCVYNSGEQGIENIMVHCDPFGYAFTNASGNYSFKVPSGSYTLSESVQYAYPLASCQNNAIPVTVTAASGCVNTVNFANNMDTIHDMHIQRTSINNPIPGNYYSQGLIVKNDGTVPEAAVQLGYRHDGQLTLTAAPSAYSQLNPTGDPNWYSVTSGFSTMAAGSSTMIYFDNFVPTSVPVSTIVDFYDTTAASAPMNNWLNDFSPWNNVQHYQSVVIGSYDPNFKEVSPKGVGANGDITTADSVLDYVIHFQNTGSYFAQKVVVMDTLDTDLDWNSLRLNYADHPYTATMTENGVLTFTFDNINLDWKDNNDMDSRGLVAYSIKQKPHLAPGTQIKNSAAIYFDYNAPVITNQTLNTIALAAGVPETKTNQNISIYPNPATQEITITMEHTENIAAITVYDLQGRVVQTEAVNKNNNVQKVSIENLMNGIYFIELKKTDGQKITGRFIKN